MNLSKNINEISHRIYYSYIQLNPKRGQCKTSHLRNYYNLTEEQFNSKIESLKNNKFMNDLKIIIL